VRFIFSFFSSHPQATIIDLFFFKLAMCQYAEVEKENISYYRVDERRKKMLFD